MKKILVSLLLAFALVSPSFAQWNGVRTQSKVFTTAVGAASSAGIGTSNTATVFNAGLYQLIWAGSGTRSTCTVQIEKATTYSGSYSLLGAAQTCTTDGSYIVFVQPAAGNAFVKIHVTAITGTGNTITATLNVFNNTAAANQLAPASQYCGTTATCANTGVAAPITVFGTLTLQTASTATLTSLPFTSSSSFVCTTNDFTSAGKSAVTAYTSGAQVTITEAGGSTADVINFICTGN